MDNNVILGIIITVVVLVPVIFLAGAGKRKNKKAVARFKDFAQSCALNLTECDCCGKLIIGLDEPAKKLVYKQADKDFEVIDLNEVKNCIAKTNSEVIDGNYIDRLDMEVEFVNANKAKKVMTFFTSENKLNMDDEHQILNSWQSRITNLIK